MKREEIVDAIDTRVWPVDMRKEYQKLGISPTEYIKQHLMDPVAKLDKPKGPPKIIEKMNQRELLDEIIELGTEKRVALLEREVHREIVFKAPTQWNRMEMTDKAFTAHRYCLRELRKLRDKGII